MNSKSVKMLFLLVFLFSSLNILFSIELTPDEEAWLEKANRYEKDGWIFVHIEGKPFERGFQHGYLLANELKEVLRVNKFLAEWYTGEDFNFFVEQANKMFTSKIDEEFMQEMKGIAAGATKAGFEITLQEIIGWNEIGRASCGERV